MLSLEGSLTSVTAVCPEGSMCTVGESASTATKKN